MDGHYPTPLTSTVSMEKSKQVRLSITAESVEVLDRLTKDGPPMSQAHVLTLILDAAMRAIRDNGNTFTYPPRFVLVTDTVPAPVPSQRRR